MKYAKPFLTQFANLIVATLGCVDRMIVKGHLFLGDDERLNRFVDPMMKRKDFVPFVEKLSQQLVDFAKQLAEESHAPYRYLQGKHRKESLVDQIDRQRKQPNGQWVKAGRSKCDMSVVHVESRPCG